MQFTDQQQNEPSVFKVILEILQTQLSLTFGRDSGLVDQDIVDVVLSNPENKRRLIKKLEEKELPDFTISIEGDKLKFIE